MMIPGSSPGTQTRKMAQLGRGCVKTAVGLDLPSGSAGSTPQVKEAAE